MDIRETRAAAPEGVATLYAAAFPDEDLAPLVLELLEEGAALGLELREDGAPVGQVCLTPCGVKGAEATVWLLGPLAVAPERQRRGIGGALIRAGLERAAKAGAAGVCVLGDPAYYGRFGFAEEPRLAPPYALPDAWRAGWQSIAVAGRAPPEGTLAPPAPWLRPELWAPPPG